VPHGPLAGDRELVVSCPHLSRVGRLATFIQLSGTVTMLSRIAQPVRSRCAVALTLAVGLLVAACDDGTPPPPRPLPAQTGATGLQVTTEAPVAKAVEITERDVLGKWIIEYSSMRDVMFNRALTVDQQSGTG